MNDTTKSRIALILLLLGGLASIGTAWGFQILGGYVPCKLCLEQRIPYYAGLPLTLLALLLLGRLPRLSIALMGIVAVVFLYGAGIGIYQAGAEWQLWAGPTDCGGGINAPAAAADMLNALKTTRVVSCTEASWRMFGLSFAGWNAVVSLGLSALALAAMVFSLDRKKG